MHRLITFAKYMESATTNGMQMKNYEANELDALRMIRTPIVYDAIERFAVRPKSEGYTDATIRSLLPDQGIFVGTAVTAKLVGEFPLAPDEHHLDFRHVWEHFAAAGRQTIAVVQDLDPVPGRASAWGDVSVAIFKRLGCVAVLTNGSVRDVPDIANMNFGLFASSVSVGHGNVRYVAVDTPVRIGGLQINPGNLLHMDEHGALIIPEEIAIRDLVRVANEIVEAEEAVKRYCLLPDFDLKKLDHMHADSMGEPLEG